MMKGEAGTALTELSLSIVPLAIFLVGALDLGRAVNEYFSLSNTAYEATRLASKTPGIVKSLSVTCPTQLDGTTLQGQLCNLAESSNLSSASFTVVRNSLSPVSYEEMYGPFNRYPGPTVYYLRCTSASPVSSITVKVEKGFAPLLPLAFVPFASRVSASVSGPYLYQPGGGDFRYVGCTRVN